MLSAVDLIDEAEGVLKASDAVDHPHAGKERYDASLILEFVLGFEPDLDDEVPSAAERRFRRLLARRQLGEPVAYITGTTEFHGLILGVGRGAFIPRESSEFMVDQAIRRIRSRAAPIYVDLATGVGPVALAVASAVPHARVLGVDVSAKPVALAKGNAARLGLSNATFLVGDLFAPMPIRFRGAIDAITLHPPYVGTREMKELPNEIRGFEPRESLTDFSPTGMRLITRTASEAPEWLRPQGWLLIEVSPDRAREVSTVLRRAGFRDVRSTRGGVSDVSRVIVGRTLAASSGRRPSRSS